MPPAAVPVAARICHDYQQGPGAVGVYLPKPVFFHGQLYVAFSRCGSRRGVRVLVRGGSRAALNGAPAGVYTNNVVYREVL
jgi:hypothetical protein